MRLLSPRLFIPLAVVVVVWGGAHLLASHDVAVTPAVWPVTAPTASPGSGPAGLAPAVPTATPSPSPNQGAVPILPGALQQLNGSTRDTAVGLYALIQQLEEAVRSRLEQLVTQLEPGR
jgi:hypothetical protein